MRISRAEAWDILGGRSGTFGAWENLAERHRMELWGQLGAKEKRALWTIFKDQPEYLPEPPPDSPKPRKHDRGLYIDMSMAVAMAKRHGVDKDELLAAIAYGEIEGITPEPGMKMLPRQPLIDWLEDWPDEEEPVDYGLGTRNGYAIIDYCELEDGTRVPVIDSDEVREMPPVHLTYWEEYGHLWEFAGALAVIIGSIICLYFIYANV